jgi:hypothetical protein
LAQFYYAVDIQAGLRHLAEIPSATPALVGGRTIVCAEDLTQKRLSRLPNPRWKPGFRHALVQSFAGGNTMILNAAGAQLLAMAAQNAKRVVMHDWWAYQVIAGAEGTVIYDPEPYVMYRQHDANVIGDNRELAAKFMRIRWMLRGRFRRWNRINIKALRGSYDLLSSESKCIVDGFDALQKAKVRERVRLLRQLGLSRSGYLGNLSLWIAVLLGRV